MDFVLAVKAFIMGIVEGLTEFLPISSTGHLILAGSLLDFTGENVKVFSIAIQAGAMLSVVWVYRQKIFEVLFGMFTKEKERRFAINVIIAFFPAAILGLLFAKKIQAFLFYPIPVAAAFIIGGLIIIFVERRNERRPEASRIQSVDD
ncbi:MAG: undecaprenyl-diphosphatase, partial [Oxalobacter sp.]|nr:undecaprenyl-diphosphatase [Oxalobacter sp.]